MSDDDNLRWTSYENSGWTTIFNRIDSDSNSDNSDSNDPQYTQTHVNDLQKILHKFKKSDPNEDKITYTGGEKYIPNYDDLSNIVEIISIEDIKENRFCRNCAGYYHRTRALYTTTKFKIMLTYINKEDNCHCNAPQKSEQLCAEVHDLRKLNPNYKSVSSSTSSSDSE
jgi:hypothetical protein